MAEAPGGLRERVERNEALGGKDVGAIGAGGGDVSRAVRLVAGRQPLTALFTLRQRRRLFRLLDASGDLGEISLDETVIPLGVEDAPVKLNRVEIEVVDVDRARRFVDVLVAATGLTPAAMGKFQAALLATGMRVSSPQDRLGPTAIDDRMTAGEVAFAVLRKHFGVFLANEGGTRLGEDIEALHDMRVAARRLRAAMSLFRAYLPVRMESLRLELGWVAGALGQVRDLDVQIERMAEWRAGFDEERAHALDAVEAILAVRREHARARMLTVLNSRRYEMMTERFSATLRRGPARRFAAGRRPPRGCARPHRETLPAGAEAGAGDWPTDPWPYHQLRIDGKNCATRSSSWGRSTEARGRIRPARHSVAGRVGSAPGRVRGHRHAGGDRADAVTPAFARDDPHDGGDAERYRQDAASLRKKFPTVWKPMAGREWTRLKQALRPGPPGRRLLGRADDPGTS
jgi:hypothetical protein